MLPFLASKLVHEPKLTVFPKKADGDWSANCTDNRTVLTLCPDLESSGSILTNMYSAN